MERVDSGSRQGFVDKERIEGDLDGKDGGGFGL